MIKFLESCSDESWMDYVNQNKQELNYKQGDYIIKSGEKLLGVYFIKSGKAKVSLRLGEGEFRIIRLASDGDILGHRGLGLNFNYPINVEALTDLSLWFIPLGVFNFMIKSNPNFAYKMIMFFADELKITEQNLANLDVEGRVAKSLYLSLKAFGYSDTFGLLSHTLSRTDLANMSNTSYASVIRTLKKFEGKKIIASQGKQIRIIDEQALHTLFNN